MVGNLNWLCADSESGENVSCWQQQQNDNNYKDYKVNLEKLHKQQRSRCI